MTDPTTPTNARHPTRFDADDPLLARVREICLAFPGAAEKTSHGRPVFFTQKIFLIYGGVVKGSHHDPALRRGIVFCPDPGEREALLEDGRFVVPAYEGARGWLCLRLDAGDPDWAEVAELIEESYRQNAPARLIAQFDAEQRAD